LLENLIGKDNPPMSGYLWPRQACEKLNCSEFELYLMTTRFKKVKRFILKSDTLGRYPRYVYKIKDVERLVRP
jgi:hypothetical protein